MTKDQLKNKLTKALLDYVNEENMTKLTDPAAFSEQLKKEEAAKERYTEAKRAFVEAQGV